MFLGLREASIGKPLLIGAGGPFFGINLYGIPLFALGGIRFIDETDGIGTPSLGDLGISPRFLAICGTILPDDPARCEPGPAGAEKFDVPLGPVGPLGPLNPVGRFGILNPLGTLGTLGTLDPLGTLEPFRLVGPTGPLGTLKPLGTILGLVEPAKLVELVTPFTPL